MDQSLVLVDTVDHDSTTAANVVDRLLCELLNTGGLDHDVESVGVVLLELLPLRTRVLPVQFDVLIGGVELLCDVHLNALVRRNDDAVCSIQLEQLCEDQASRAGAEE